MVDLHLNPCIGGAVVHHRTPKPTQHAYHSTDEESLRELLRPLAEASATVLTAESAARIRAKFDQQRAQAVEHGYVD